MTLLSALALLAVGCRSSHTDAIVLKITQKTGNRGFLQGESRKLIVSVYGGGGRLETSFYDGPVTVTFDAPAGITVEPNPLVIDMKPTNSYDRSKTSRELALTVSDDMPLGDCQLSASASTNKGTTATASIDLRIMSPNQLPETVK